MACLLLCYALTCLTCAFQAHGLKHNVSMQLNFIANESVSALSGQTLDVVDPSDGHVFDQIQRSQASDIDQAVHAARVAFQGPWGQLSGVERGRLLMALSRKVSEHAAEPVSYTHLTLPTKA